MRDWLHSSWVDNCISRAIFPNWRKRCEVGQAARERKTSQIQNVNSKPTDRSLTPQKVGRGEIHPRETFMAFWKLWQKGNKSKKGATVPAWAMKPPTLAHTKWAPVDRNHNARR